MRESATMSVLELASPECIAEDFDGEVVILNQSTGLYFAVQGSALEIWNALVNGHAVEEVLEAFTDPAIVVEIRRFVEELVERGLLRPAAARGQSASTPLLLATVEALGAPRLETYDDMRSILLLCPVHDTEEPSKPDDH
jgi:hypothetical protein